jgi:hypothetical protein
MFLRGRVYPVGHFGKYPVPDLGAAQESVVFQWILPFCEPP